MPYTSATPCRGDALGKGTDICPAWEGAASPQQHRETERSPAGRVLFGRAVRARTAGALLLLIRLMEADVV